MKPAKPPAPSSPLGKLFAKQQPKVKASIRKRNLLATFADDDYKKIAMLIQSWLAESEKKDPYDK